MSTEITKAEPLHQVLVNDEGQYSLWPLDKVIPLGWSKAGESGTKEACLTFINGVWTDMRPLSLQNEMEVTKVN